MAMKFNILLVLSFLVLLSDGCKNKPGNVAKPGEGMVVYKVTYPDGSKYGIKSNFFPKEIVLVFKDKKAAFIATAGLGMVQLVNLMDYQTKTYTSLLIDRIHGNYACALTPEEIKQNEGNPKYQFELTGDTKIIAGVKSNKAIVTDLASKTTFEVYYDDKIKFYYWNSPFKDLNYLFTEYTHTINNLTMKLEATEVNLTSPVDTALFNLKGNYLWVSQQEFYRHLGEL